MLSGVSLDSLFSATNVMLRLRSLAYPVTNDTSLRQAVAALHERCTKVQQFIRATFCLFGLVPFFRLAMGIRNPQGIVVLRLRGLF
jgi:hypothetical protein